MEIISDNHRKANKEHICDWCGHKIKKGEMYQNATCINDYIYTWKNHDRCMALYHELNMRDYDDGYGVDGDSFRMGVYEFLSEKLTSEEYDDVLDADDEITVACRLLGIEE